jgi:hypothetical protein
VALDEEDVRSIIVGMFDVNRRLHRIVLDVRANRRELVEQDDDGEEEEEGY